MIKINNLLLDEFRNSSSKILAVTKYLDNNDTGKVMLELENAYPDILV
ncbi:hypothetical protein HOF65_08115 [bacterium]|jgi:hypothetical protein|nr:hypothetical protein [bacterium]MBT4632416.1 hypothetical protein [bacterium]MBT5490941.1 hypothetical protein [bacterium]MBT6778502.1 hypothetical protein [bacterium]